MNSIDFRTEKANAIFRYRNLQTITNLFRLMEICVFVVVISTFSSQLPFSVRFSADCFRGMSFASFSPKFVFIIGNVIVLILLFISRTAENGDRNGKIDVYDECVKRCEKSVVNSATDIVAIRDRTTCRSQSEKMMRIECINVQNHRKLKRSVTDRNVLMNVDFSGDKTPAPEICKNQWENMMTMEFKHGPNNRKLMQKENVYFIGDETPAPKICRSSSEKMMSVECEDVQSRRKLMRAVTEKKILKNVDYLYGETPAPERCGVDELSGEAFRRMVEAFIAKQQRSLRDEELVPVPYVGA
ncbi:hypothetical protein E3N88_34371 [Mikania micrantha]|uniref:DUF4408 domain-containing protein n=1 Tax=Mikania micrantha TaxID=192012 RepID=A0A5N6LY74_9ASTR|nr:hypothetical protein E3N88_34371 [Mikania micrantha]